MAERKGARRLPNLSRLREDRLLTQQELAEKAGCIRTTIARIENGGTARFSTIKALAAALEVEPRALLGD